MRSIAYNQPPFFGPSPTSVPTGFSPHGRLPSIQTIPHPPQLSSPRSRLRGTLQTPDEEADAVPDIPLRSLASRLEVARLVADGHVVSTEEDENGQVSRDRSLSPDAVSLGAEVEGRPVKRARFMSDSSARSGRSLDSRGRPKQASGLRNAMPRQKGDLAGAFGDPVDMGYCSDEEGRKLVDL